MTRKDLRRGAALTAALMLTACAGSNPAHSEAERVTPAMWAEAQANAARLSGLSRDLGGSRALIVHVPFAELGHVTDHAAQAAAYDREHNVVLFRDDRPWQSDRGHHVGIAIHEAVHTLQPDDMPKGCREQQAYAAQAAWLLEQGASARADEMARRGLRYRC